MDRSTHRLDIDGLRALAVLPVVFYHAGFGFPGGFVGVDVFFVISGYLITGILWRGCEAGRLDLGRFWERRIRRILPPLVVVLLASLVAGWFILLADDFKLLGATLAAQSAMAANIHLWRESGYFQEPAELNPLLHTWSLAVEEQFYLILPLVLVARKWTKNGITVILVMAAAVSLAISLYSSYRYPSANFYLLPGRAWELLVGSILALVPWKTSARWIDEAVGSLGVLAIVMCVFLYDRDTRFPGLAALPPCLGAAAIIWANRNQPTFSGRLLAWRPLVFIGLISYSLYLWHWPLLVFGRWWAVQWTTLSTDGRLPAHLGALLLVLAFVMATASWAFVERPIREKRWFRTRSSVFRSAGISTAGLLLLGVLTFQMAGFPSRFPAEVTTFLEARKERGAFQDGNLDLEDAQKGRFVELGIQNHGESLNFLVWGDSHAKAVMPLLDQLCREHSMRGAGAVRSSLIPLLGYQSYFWDETEEFNQEAMAFVESRGIRDVILIANWSNYIKVDQTSDRLRAGFERTLEYCESRDIRLWVMLSVPTYNYDVPRSLASAVRFGRHVNSVGLSFQGYEEKLKKQQSIFGDSAQSHFTVLDPAEYFRGPGGKTLVQIDGKSLYSDSNHLTESGSMRLRPLFEPVLREISNSGGN
jgi:peptidoglycan/LPS O-acetylase OafA/YrhL